MRRLLVLAIGVVGCSKQAPQQSFEPPPVPVQTATVVVRDVPLFFEAMGVIKPSKRVEVKSQVQGMIKEVHFIEGQWVEEGALLYTIDETPYAIRMQELQALLTQDSVHLNHAKKRLERYKSLSNQDVIAKVQWDELETEIALHEGQLQANQARLTAAHLEWQHCHITAPIAGFAGKNLLGAGNKVSGESLVTLTQNDPLSVDFSITEHELQEIKATNLPITIYLTGSDELIASGRVAFLDHVIDPKSGLLAVSGLLENVERPLWPGQSVRVHLYFGKKEEAKLVPVRCIKINQEGPYLFIVKEDDTVEMRSVRLGPEEKGEIVVEEGVDGLDKVILEGHSRLFPGSKVQVK